MTHRGGAAKRAAGMALGAWCLAAAAAAGEGPPLALRDAVARALTGNPELRAAVAGAEEGEARTAEARSVLFPRVDLAESWMRGDNPVFAFATRLEQGRFGERDFDLDRLNDPDPITDHQTSIRAEWALLDPASFARLRAAGAGRELSRERRRAVEQQVIHDTLAAYFRSQLAERSAGVLRAAIAAANADLARAEARRDAGLISEADVLAVRVLRAEIEERRIRADSEAGLAMAELDRSMGVPLDQTWNLVTPLLTAPGAGGLDAAEAERLAGSASPTVRGAEQAIELAAAETARAEGGFLPALGVYGGWELDRPEMFADGEDSWMVGATLRINLFSGFGDRSRRAASLAGERRARADAERARSQVSLAARRAVVERDAARERQRVTATAVTEARESRRITTARFEAGLASTGDLLRAETALLDAELRELEAAFAARLASAAVELAAGTLGAQSEVLQP